MAEATALSSLEEIERLIKDWEINTFSKERKGLTLAERTERLLLMQRNKIAVLNRIINTSIRTQNPVSITDITT